ncbi:histidinol dehydrogenase [Desulfobulbus propionicus DSM 2032]|uniref:Histidinol dehydrogenase n=1 Tax=Desulfobulbus propionicus (strain ATCC 33891 / DSM 2032 / VKM B-1956 / 1pr3) TaxID=577650 RepID=A0A7U4DNH8_DESPD|nr:histidinol dehydrogenase [Desulfobulbus propionicus]ADW17081.1 histidinol dehydrogenase [Desulfobulbus propionicus DSM 2032]
MKITTLNINTPEGRQRRADLRNRFTEEGDGGCREAVAAILARIRREGDAAVLDYCRRFDSPVMTLDTLRVSAEEFALAEREVDDPFRQTLRLAAERVRVFHERELEDSWMLTRDDGTITGRMVRPVDSAGLYVPGGKEGSTPLVSSVLMNGIPAQIAGVGRRVMVTPPNREGRVNPALLVAAREIGIDEVYKIGSAWAIAALAFGTESVPAVDVIVGPGNQYVAEAKRQVMGRVRIDMLAGPSEVLIVADDTAQAAFVAADMLAQAEHDPQALAMVITTSESLAGAIVRELELQLPQLPRADIARTALNERGLILLADSLEQAIELANEIAIEHLELQIAEPWQWLPKIRHAGAIFLGSWTPEAAGDYVAGPNHVLPTMGTARIASALGVETFLKKSSIISYSRQALEADGNHIRRLAALEGLTAHGNSVAIRLGQR